MKVFWYAIKDGLECGIWFAQMAGKGPGMAVCNAIVCAWKELKKEIIEKARNLQKVKIFHS